MTYDVKRKRTSLDPRMLVGGNFGQFMWLKWGTDADGNQLEVWQFETEAARSKFIKQYGGEEFTCPIITVPSSGTTPLDPDCDFFWDRK